MAKRADSAGPVVAAYVDGVLSGRDPACELLKAACRRYRADVAEGPKRGLYHDSGAAQLAIDFFSVLKHSKGEWAGQRIVLEPWQQFVLWEVFGWKTEDGRRRFRTCYLEVARKNGKSTFAAGIGLFLLVADGEPGAEVYTAATVRDQARISHSEASRMVKSSAALRKRITVFRDNLHIPDTASKFEPLSSDYNALHGLNVHGAIVDEVHAHKTRDLWDVLETSTGSRRQPLTVAITTAGVSRQSICWELHNYTESVVNGAIEDDTFFGLIYGLDPEDAEADHWQNEDIWRKANPNLGISKKWDDMRRKAAKAAAVPSALNAFLRLELNVWTQAITKWVPWEKWLKCGQAVDPDGLRGRTCYGGLDLSSNIDISAFVLVFPPAASGDPYQVLCRFWVPEDAIHVRSRRDRVPYESWLRQGYIESTPGDVIDYDFIFDQISQDAEGYDLQEIAFDRWGSVQIVNRIQEQGLTCVQFGQGFASMSPPMKELEKLIIGGDLAHGGHPVLNWMADNLVARQDPAGNIKPDKERSHEKIDGMVSLIMALDRAIRHEDSRSVYEDRPLRTL